MRNSCFILWARSSFVSLSLCAFLWTFFSRGREDVSSFFFFFLNVSVKFQLIAIGRD